MFSEEIRIIRLTADVAERGGVAHDDTWEKTQKETVRQEVVSKDEQRQRTLSWNSVFPDTIWDVYVKERWTSVTAGDGNTPRTKPETVQEEKSPNSKQQYHSDIQDLMNKQYLAFNKYMLMFSHTA